MARERIHCPKCKGTGKVTKFGRDRVLGKRVKMQVACLNCNGTGIVERMKFNLGPKLKSEKELKQLQENLAREREDELPETVMKFLKRKKYGLTEEQEEKRQRIANYIILFLVIVLIIVLVVKC